jgi:hypothetical protein
VNCCEWCQAESELLVPVINRDLTRSHENDLVCPTCAELEASEHLALWNMPLFMPRWKGRRHVNRSAA